MKHKWVSLFSVIALFSLMIVPVSPVQAQVVSSVGHDKSLAMILSPASGGILHFPLIGNPVTLDPAQLSLTSEYGVGLQIFEGLTLLDQNNNVVPGIASSWSSPDAIVWTFNLRNDVYFHNGRQVKAADFVYSWNRAKNAGGSYAGYFYDINTFTAPNDFTFVVTLTNPYSTFPVRVTMPIFTVIPSESANTIGTNPVGAGAFEFVSWTANTITLQKYPNYYGSSAYLDTIEFKFYENTDAEWADFQASNLDLTPIPSSQWNAVKTDPNVIKGKIMLMQSFGFSVSAFPNVQVRKAFQKAINRTAIASIFTLYDPPQIANGVISPGKGAYDNSGVVISYDPSGALSLLASAGWTDTNGDGILDNGAGSNLSVVLQDSANAGWHAAALSTSNDLTNIGGSGVGVAVTLSTDQNLTTIKRMGWISDYPAPDNDLSPFRTGGIFASRISYSSIAFDNYHSTALATLNETTRNAAFYSADSQLVLNDAAVLPLYYGSMTPVLKKSHVNNLLFLGQGESITFLKNVWLSPGVLSVTRAGINPTAAASAHFTVTFNKSVTGVDTSAPFNDFAITTTGVTGAGIIGVSGSGTTYTVTVNTGSGNGTVRLDVVDDDSIKDGGNNPLGGVGTGNGNFTSGEVYHIRKSAIFNDVPDNYWAVNYIERLYNAGITGGCNMSPLNYCPETEVTRAQMAVFLLRGIHGASYSPPAVGASTGFGDVALGYWAAAWIKQLAAEGITGGCGSGNYCPEVTVTRAQMAVFLLRAEHGSAYSPPVATGVFTDVPVGYWADRWIERLAAEAITGGCGTGIYCPETPVTRAQMAVFLVRTFKLP